MATYVLEATWEEIEQHKAELIGRQLRVIVETEKLEKLQNPSSSDKKVERVSAYGKYAGILSSEDFLRQKHEEIKLEDQRRR